MSESPTNLSRHHPEEFTEDVMNLIADFIRTSRPIASKGGKDDYELQAPAHGQDRASEVRLAGKEDAPSRDRDSDNQDQRELEHYADLQRAIDIISTRSSEEFEWYSELTNRGLIDLRASDLHAVSPKGTEFRQLNLMEACLSKGHISHCDFSGSKVSSANFQDAEMFDVILDDTDLDNATFAGAQGGACSFRRANLLNADFEAVSLGGSLLVEAYGRQARFDHADLRFSEAVGANFDHASFIGTTLIKSDFTKAVLANAKFTKADLRMADLTEAVLTRADLTGAKLSKVNLSKADLEFADLTKATLVGANLTGCNLHGTNLCGADMSDVQGLTQEQLDMACQSQGPEPRFNSSTLTSKKFKWDKKAALRRYRESKKERSD